VTAIDRPGVSRGAPEDERPTEHDGLADALRAAGVAEVDVSRRRRAEYASDASNYRVVPRVVAFPRHVEEVEAALAVCRERGAALTPRGGGTSIAGNAVGPGLVLDFSRHLNRIEAVDVDTSTATVEPGAVLDAVTAAAAPHRLRFGPDPSTHSRATVGGSLANNACGSRALGYGRCSDNVVALDVVTASGERFIADGLDLAPDWVRTGLKEVVAAREAAIRAEFGRFSRQASGYGMEHLLADRGADLARFLVGSEGTLAVTLGATVRLTAAPEATALAVIGYPDMPTAAESVPALLAHRPVAIEGLDARLIDTIRRRRGPAGIPELPAGGGWLLVEVTGLDAGEAQAAAEAACRDAGGLASTVVSGATAAALWRIREDGAGLGGRTPRDRPGWPGFEDSAVPPERLAEYLRDLERLFATHDVDGLVYGHFGDGCVHARIDFPLSGRPGALREFMLDAASVVGAYGGSLSGEHGDGRARSELLGAMYSPAAVDAMAAVKHLLDPSGMLNPGVIVDPAPLDGDLRVAAARSITTGLGFTYRDDHGDLSRAVHRCVGVGKCRADLTGTGGVMCPSYLATRDEKDSTRGRARVLQELANGTLVDGFAAPELAESLDLCLACKGCSSDCPAGVDMATYKAEVLHQRYKGRLRPRSHYALGWLPRWARVASLRPRWANALTRSPRRARLAKRLAGIDQRRPLPAFADRSFRHWFADRPSPPPDLRPVVLWVDTFSDHFSPDVAQAAVAVLEDAGYGVRVPESACCGLTWISTGQLDGARRQLRRTLDALGPALGAGTPIVALEPSCTAVLRSDAAELLPDDPRAEQAARAVLTLAELLSSTEGWEPPDLRGVTAVAQPHCHHHAVMGWDADAKLLATAGAEVTRLGGCCGLAGNFGVEDGHHDVSVAVAETALLPAVRNAPDGAVVLADGFSCRTQLDQLASRPGVHLAQLLADHLPAAGGDPA
jgi:FAD/FMN-containing dehydrogenase/Fe-S oxidoreductase